MMKQIMVKAHELAKMMEGDYQARLALALRAVWKEVKEMKDDVELCELVGTEKQVAYANDIREFILAGMKEAFEEGIKGYDKRKFKSSGEMKRQEVIDRLDADKQASYEEYEAVYAKLASIESTEWWINNGKKALYKKSIVPFFELFGAFKIAERDEEYKNFFRTMNWGGGC